MSYVSLEKLLHLDSSSARFSANESIARRRLEAESTFRTGISTEAGELFLAVPRDLSILNEEVLRLERRVSLGLACLPRIAQGALVRSLVIDEVVCTNELEGVHSTRRQISDLLESTDSPDQSTTTPERKRFRELARLYLELSDRDHVIPKVPSDVRRIYDRVMQGEDLSGNEPDGELFRKGGVEIIGSGGRVLHAGLEPESRIIAFVQKMIDIAKSKEIPEVYSSIVAHYLFEYTHPFYDGNGRTGRYLLALYLSRALSTITALSLSRAIAENRGPYYRAFNEAERPLNHGELTMFVITMLRYVRDAQEGLVADLESKRAQLDMVDAHLDGFGVRHSLQANELQVVSQLAQYRLFGTFADVPLAQIAHYLGLGTQMTRKYLKRLETAELVEAVTHRPLRFALTAQAEKELEIRSL